MQSSRTKAGEVIAEQAVGASPALFPMKFKPCIDPRLRLKVEALPEDLRYEFEERAGILEHEGGMHRATAEPEAYKQITGK